jgi:hypothetical protein
MELGTQLAVELAGVLLCTTKSALAYKELTAIRYKALVFVFDGFVTIKSVSVS